MLMNRLSNKGGSGSGSTSTPGSGGGDAGEAPAVVDFKAEVPRLAPAAPFTLKDNIVPIEISEYAGYAGLIAANGGLEPTENSVFFKNDGFKVKLTLSEDESWGDLNHGQDRRLGDDRRRAGRLRPPVPRGGAGADRLLARRRRPRRPHGHQEDQRPQGQAGRHLAVHRGRLLHPLPRAGGRPDGQRARRRRRRRPSRDRSTWSTPRKASRPASCSCTTCKSGANQLAGLRDLGADSQRGGREERRRRQGRSSPTRTC